VIKGSPARQTAIDLQIARKIRLLSFDLTQLLLEKKLAGD
jgi:hypothetical protein